MAASTGGPRTRGRPLMTTVTMAVVTLMLIATGAIGISSYLTAQEAVDTMWRGLAKNLTNRTTEQVLRFLSAAGPFAATADAMLRSGGLSLDDPEGILRFLEMSADANPQFTWASFGDESARFLAVYRWPAEDGEEMVLRRTWREQVPGAKPRPDGHRAAHFRDYQRDAEGRWRLIAEDRERAYDPRVRPWYRAVSETDTADERWIDPYVMLSRWQPGVAYAKASRADDGRLLGVWAAEFEAGPISDFLRSVPVSENGRVYVVDQDGRVIGHPNASVLAGDGKQGRFVLAGEHPDAMLSGAWREHDRLGPAGQGRPFAFGDYVAMAEPFPAASGIPWVVLTVVPEDDLFGGLQAQVNLSLVITLAAIALITLFGIMLSRRLTASIRRIRGEMARIAQFELDGGSLAPTAVRELNEMQHATETMKEGLRSFSRYVPHQLVGHLLRSGGEAKVGGEVRELTIVFSDIAGFTTMVESTAPDEVLARLGDYLDAMNDAIRSTDGTVCQYLGDAVLAFWGAPEGFEDHAVRACRGVLAMKAASERLAAEAERDGLTPFHTRFSVNTGPVMVGNIGSHERFNYGILGDPVNTAARLEGLNTRYGTGIMIGAHTAEAIGDAFVVRPIEWVRMKGKQKAMLVYELIGTPEEVPAELREAIETHRRAFEAYQAGRWAEALAGFEQVDRRLDGDGPSQLLAKHCREALETNPSDWHPVHVMATK